MTSKKKQTKKNELVNSRTKLEIDFTDEKLVNTVLAGFSQLDQDIKNERVKVEKSLKKYGESKK